MIQKNKIEHALKVKKYENDLFSIFAISTIISYVKLAKKYTNKIVRFFQLGCAFHLSLIIITRWF